jgi:hypothetical protein
MTRTRLGLLGLCAMVFGLMAFSAAGAQAAGQWLFAEKAGSNLIKFLEAELELEKETTLVLHSKILGIEVLFLCEEIHADAKLIANGAIGTNAVEKGGKVLFKKCVTHLNGKTAPECTPKDPVGGEGTITTKPGHALLTLHVLKATGLTDDVITVTPDEGETFATVAMSATCPIGTSVPVIGKLVLKECENLGLTHLVKHLVEALKELTELWTISKTEEHKATLLGSAWAFLIGEHLGVKFSGDPD